MKKLSLLKNFVLNNHDLEKLESILNEFNPLNVLKVNHYEIRHSNVLSWLLDPNGNHRMGDIFLRKVLYEIVTKNELINAEVDVFELRDLSFNKIEVKREWSNIDILLIDPANKIVIYIENKVHSSESKGQLDKYQQIINDNYKDFKKIPVYLTLYGDEPSNDSYGILSYLDILKILKSTLELNEDFLNSKIYDFINYYYKTLERLTMEDKEIKALCKKIYKEHKDALDMINQHTSDDEFENAAEVFEETLELRESSFDGLSLWMVPESIAINCNADVAEENWCWGYPISFRFVYKETKMGFIVEVGPFLDGDKRSKFLSHLKKYKYQIGDKSLLPSARYTRIFTKYPNFDDWDNQESIVQKFSDLHKTYMEKQVETLAEACSTFNWDD